MSNMKKLLITKNTIIELAILFIFYILINKYLFILLLILIMILLYKSNKASNTSNIPLPKDIGISTMKAFLENPNNASDSLKDKYIFQDKDKIPQLKSETDILIKVYSAALNEVDYIYLFSQFPFLRWFKMSHYGVGMDFSGKVMQVGKEVTKFKMGDEVFGFGTLGVL